MPDDAKPSNPEKRAALRDMASGAADFATRYLPGAGILRKLDQVREQFGGFTDAEKQGDARYLDMHGRNFFRPPGALREPDFLDACSRCKKCVEACPEQVITPAQSHMGPPVDTPILMPNQGACTMCGECMEVCPTGALAKTPVSKIRIGIAVVEPDSCLGYKGEVCTACHRACPLEPNAIAFDRTMPKVDSRVCTGCGLCVAECPTDPKSIVVLPRPARP